MDDTAIEDRIRSALATGVATAEAGSGPPTPDPGDLARRRVAHHRRLVAGRVAAALVLVAIGVGGWALGRDPGGDREEVAGREDPTTVTATTEPERTDGVVLADEELPVVAPVVTQQRTGAGGLLRGETEAGAAASVPSRIRRPDMPWYDSAVLPTVPLFTRPLDDGTTIAVAGNRYDPAIYELPTFWDPPAHCFPSGDLVVTVTGADGRRAAISNRYDAVVDGDLLVAAAPIGEAEDRWLAVVQGPPGTASIRVTFPGGAGDEMAVADGIAVLTAPTVAGVEIGGYDPVDDPPAAEMTAVAVDADGAELARYVGPWTLSDTDGRPTGPEVPFRRPDCAWPTTLPPPGPDQPDDPAAAEAAVREVWEGAFGHPGVTTAEEKLAVIDDPRGVAEGLAEVGEMARLLDLRDDTTRIDGVVFATPARAHIRFTVDPGPQQGLPAGGMFGELVLVDGEWKVTRLTACRLVVLGGGACSPLPTG